MKLVPFKPTKAGPSLVSKDNKEPKKNEVATMRLESYLDMPNLSRELEPRNRFQLVRASVYSQLVMKLEEITHMLKSRSTEI